MAYVEGYILAVPEANKEAYRKMASDAALIFRKHGAIGFTECWGDDVPVGKTNCFNSAVMKKPDEVVMFSWIVWPDRASRDDGNQSVMADDEMKAFPSPAPLDGSRMIFGGFELIGGDAAASPHPIGYVDGNVMPVKASRRADYIAAATKLAAVFREHGALDVVDCWSDDLPVGKVNSFHTAVLREPDEAVVFSWINWPDKAARDAGWEKVGADPRMAEFGPASAGADMQRMIFGGFTPLVIG